MLTEIERRRLVTQAPSQFREATVQDPPLDADGWLRVVIDEEPDVVHSCPWMPRADADPSGKDAALVAESDAGNYWAVCWWPQT